MSPVSTLLDSSMFTSSAAEPGQIPALHGTSLTPHRDLEIGEGHAGLVVVHQLDQHAVARLQHHIVHDDPGGRALDAQRGFPGRMAESLSSSTLLSSLMTSTPNRRPVSSLPLTTSARPSPSMPISSSG